MRRKDREITDISKICEIISACHCCRIGFNDNGKVYIVPLSFGFSENNGRYVFYFHGAREGRKINLIKSNKYAGFEMDTNYMLKEGENACNYSACFQSVIGNGIVSFIEDSEEKKFALNKIMEHNSGKGKWKFKESMLNAVCVFRLAADEISCKEHL